MRLGLSVALAALALVAGGVYFSFYSGAANTSLEVKELFTPWEREDSPGCVVGVVRGGEFLFAEAFGMADIAAKRPMRVDTPLRIASISKQFTAACILMLEKEGKLSLDSPIHKYIHRLPKKIGNHRPVTIADCLYHTSGLPSWDDYKAKRGNLDVPPGTTFKYNDTGYFFLAEIVRKVSKNPLHVFADERIFKPLGMTATQFDAAAADVAAGYTPISNNQFVRNESGDLVHGPSGLVSTVKDLARWQTVLGGELSWLSDKMTESGRLDNGERTGYGAGVQMREFEGTTMVFHGGAIAGYTGVMARFPERDLSIIILTNCGLPEEGAEPFPLSDLLAQTANAFLSDIE